MHLADVCLLSSEEIQLLVDSMQQVFVLELTPVAETLIQRRLLRSSRGICPHSKRTCFFLATTDSGRAYVAEWISTKAPDVQMPSALSEQVYPRTWLVA